MATIVGGFAVSHTPTIGFAYDAKKNEDPVWKPIFDGFKPLQKWLAEKKPDVILYVFNDHITSFFLSSVSAQIKEVKVRCGRNCSQGGR